MNLNLNVEFILKQWVEQTVDDTMRMIHALRSTTVDDLMRHVDAPAGLVYQIIDRLSCEGFVDLSSEDGHSYVCITKKGDDYIRYLGMTIHYDT